MKVLRNDIYRPRQLYKKPCKANEVMLTQVKTIVVENSQPKLKVILRKAIKEYKG